MSAPDDPSNTNPWKVEVTPPALRDLDRIPPRYAAAIIEFITTVLPTNPPRVGKLLHNELEGIHSARRGDYRVLYRIDHPARYAYIIRIDHRANAYRRR